MHGSAKFFRFLMVLLTAIALIGFALTIYGAVRHARQIPASAFTQAAAPAVHTHAA